MKNVRFSEKYSKSLLTKLNIYVIMLSQEMIKG